MPAGHDLVVWFVLFPACGGAPRWWQRLLHPGYRHCFAMREAGDGRTLLVNHAGAQLCIETLAQPLALALRARQRETTAWCLMVTLPPGFGPAPWRPAMTCVEAVKAALGLHAFWVLTPRALARHLRRRHHACAVLPLPA
jgi:hypothetical protein